MISTYKLVIISLKKQKKEVKCWVENIDVAKILQKCCYLFCKILCKAKYCNNLTSSYNRARSRYKIKEE